MTAAAVELETALTGFSVEVDKLKRSHQDIMRCYSLIAGFSSNQMGVSELEMDRKGLILYRRSVGSTTD